jgi:DNA-binding transcriptional LysR family regulator
MRSWDDLRVFLAVARGGTLAAAAGQLGLNASTVHRHIAAMETDLGVALFVKGPRGYGLTPAGEALLPRAVEAEEGVFAAERVVRGHDRQASGEVRFTLTADLLPVVAPHLAAFRELHPGVTVVLIAADELLDLSRNVDVALRPGRSAPESALGRKITSLSWCLYAARDTADDAPWVVYDGMAHVDAVRWRRATLPDARGIMAVDRVSAMVAVLCCVAGRGLLPCYVGDPDPRLRRVGEPMPEGDTCLWLLVHADLRRAARVRALVDFLAPRLAARSDLFTGKASGTPAL